MQKSSQVIQGKKKKEAARPQLSFGLNTPEEISLKESFATLAGSRGSKDVLMQFMRAFVDSGGRLEIAGPGIYHVTTSTGVEPQQKEQSRSHSSQHEKLHKMLGAILSSGNSIVAEAIAANLRAFSLVAEVMGERTVDPDTDEQGNQPKALTNAQRLIASAEEAEKAEPAGEGDNPARPAKRRRG